MSLHPQKVRKILIIKLASISDVLFAYPLVSNLDINFPEAQIHWLGDPWTKPALERIPRLTKLLFYDRPWLGKSRLKSYLDIPFLVKKLRDESYDLALIAHRSPLAFRLASLAAIPLKVGFYEDKPHRSLDVNVRFDFKKHAIERNLDLLRALHLRVESKSMIFILDDEEAERLTSRFFELPKGDYVCVGPGGGKNPGLSMALKRWPKEKYLALAAELKKLGLEIVLLGTQSDEEICNFIASKTKLVNLCGRTSLAEAAAVIKGSKLYIGNDSALLYIAAAVDTKALGIYGPTDPNILAPLNENSSYAINEVECSPCYMPESTIQGSYDECPFNQRCLQQLDVEEVLEHAATL